MNKEQKTLIIMMVVLIGVLAIFCYMYYSNIQHIKEFQEFVVVNGIDNCCEMYKTGTMGTWCMMG